MKTMTNRTFIILGLVLAGLCLVRVFSVLAATRESGDVEVYSATEDSESDGGDEENSRSSSSDEDGRRAEIRLSRPDESADRIADQGYELVPGAEKVAAREAADSSLVVPRKAGRAIASEAGIVDAKSEPVSAPAQATATLRANPLTPDVIEPKPFTVSDAKSRASESRREDLVVSNNPLGRRAIGIRSESETRASLKGEMDSPMPPSAMASRAGVQEISLIVSDYGYFPNRIFVTQNVPVKIYLTTPSKATMCFMLDPWGLKKGVSPGKIEEISFVPETPGNFRFYCPVKSISGTLTVRETVVAGQSARGLASEREDPLTSGRGNEPKRAAQLRALAED